MQMSSSEALSLLKPYGFNTGKDLSRVLHGSLKSLDKRDVLAFVEECKPKRLHLIYGERMSWMDISKELLISKGAIEALLRAKELRSFDTSDVEELLGRIDGFLTNKKIFWSLYREASEEEMAEICNCSVDRIWKIVLGKECYTMPEKIKQVSRQVIAWDILTRTSIKVYVSLRATEEDGYCRKMVGRSADAKGIREDGRVCGEIEGVKFFYLENFGEEVEELMIALRTKIVKCDISH